MHLAAEGHPIIGDEFYGVLTPLITRQALHARAITLTHPVTGLALTVTAPLPDDMAALVASLDLHADGAASAPSPSLP